LSALVSELQFEELTRKAKRFIGSIFLNFFASSFLFETSEPFLCNIKYVQNISGILVAISARLALPRHFRYESFKNSTSEGKTYLLKEVFTQVHERTERIGATPPQVFKSSGINRGIPSPLKLSTVIGRQYL